MNGPDLNIEFYSEVLSIGEEMKQEVRERLEALTEGHKDIIEASVAVEDLAGEDTPFLYKARIVLYMRPENIAVVEKGDTIIKSLKEALSTVERQVRKQREKLKETSQAPKMKAPDVVFELSPVELYDTYTPDTDPQQLLELGRSDLATSLMVDEEMDQKAAYYVADHILEYAENAIEGV